MNTMNPGELLNELLAAKASVEKAEADYHDYLEAAEQRALTAFINAVKAEDWTPYPHILARNVASAYADALEQEIFYQQTDYQNYVDIVLRDYMELTGKEAPDSAILAENVAEEDKQKLLMLHNIWIDTSVHEQQLYDAFLPE